MRAHPRLHSLAPSMASGCSRGCDGGHHCSRFPRCSQWLHHQPEEVHHLLHVGSVLHHPWWRATQRAPTPAHTRRQWVVSTGRESQCWGLGWWEKKARIVTSGCLKSGLRLIKWFVVSCQVALHQTMTSAGYPRVFFLLLGNERLKLKSPWCGSANTMHCLSANPYALKSMFRYPDKYELIWRIEHFLWKSMINLSLIPSAIQYIGNVYIYTILQVFVWSKTASIRMIQ